MRPHPDERFWSCLASAVLLLAFVLLAIRCAGPNELAADVRLLTWIQGRSWPVLETLGSATNWLFDGLPVSIAMAAGVVLLVMVNRRPDALILILVAILKPVNGLLKDIIESPRPGPEFARATEASSGWGFPSGHTASAVLVCGFIAWMCARATRLHAARVAIWVMAGIVVGITGFGRMSVGAHWPSDVLGGVLWTAAALVLVIAFADRLTGRIRS